MQKRRSTTWIRFRKCWHVWIRALDSLYAGGYASFTVLLLSLMFQFQYSFSPHRCCRFLLYGFLVFSAVRSSPTFQRVWEPNFFGCGNSFLRSRDQTVGGLHPNRMATTWTSTCAAFGKSSNSFRSLLLIDC